MVRSVKLKTRLKSRPMKRMGAIIGTIYFFLCALNARGIRTGAIAIILLAAVKLLPLVQKGEHAELPEVTFFRAKSMRIVSQKTVNMQMDGETTCATTYEAKILPGALWVRI